MIDTIVLMVIIYFSHKSEKAPGQPELGPFAIRSGKLEADPTPARNARPVRRL